MDEGYREGASGVCNNGARARRALPFPGGSHGLATTQAGGFDADLLALIKG
ncbi:hypothetical protein AB4Z46_01265 [Variovorax sp. M-6]|uniref:hypothetical protein n=1 Tax=Variovorax sp. M-6 TaxID=3233041 RepID=UPI003F973C22